jgi:hypothetical protein
MVDPLALEAQMLVREAGIRAEAGRNVAIGPDAHLYWVAGSLSDYRLRHAAPGRPPTDFGPSLSDQPGDLAWQPDGIIAAGIWNDRLEQLSFAEPGEGWRVIGTASQLLGDDGLVLEIEHPQRIVVRDGDQRWIVVVDDVSVVVGLSSEGDAVIYLGPDGMVAAPLNGDPSVPLARPPFHSVSYGPGETAVYGMEEQGACIGELPASSDVTGTGGSSAARSQPSEEPEGNRSQLIRLP